MARGCHQNSKINTIKTKFYVLHIECSTSGRAFNRTRLFKYQVRKKEGIIIYVWYISGMTVQDFRGFPSLQEVECFGGSLRAEVKVLSLKIFRSLDGSILAYANPLTNECITYLEFSSCVIDASDTRNTRVRILVSDLEQGQSRRYGCEIISFKSGQGTNTSVSYIVVRRKGRSAARLGANYRQIVFVKKRTGVPFLCFACCSISVSHVCIYFLSFFAFYHLHR